MRSIPYFTDADRSRFIEEAQLQGETMLHDEILGGIPTLTFDILPVTAPAKMSEFRILVRKLARQDLTLPEICQLLRLQGL